MVSLSTDHRVALTEVAAYLLAIQNSYRSRERQVRDEYGDEVLGAWLTYEYLDGLMEIAKQLKSMTLATQPTVTVEFIDPNITMSQALRLVRDQQKRLSENELISRQDRRHLVYSALAIASITYGQAASILGVSVLEVRQTFIEWLRLQPEYIRHAANIALDVSEEALEALEASNDY